MKKEAEMADNKNITKNQSEPDINGEEPNTEHSEPTNEPPTPDEKYRAYTKDVNGREFTIS